MKKVVKRCLVLALVIAIVMAVAGCNTKKPVVQITWDPTEYQPDVNGEIVFTYAPGATSERDQIATDSIISEFERKYAGTQVTADYTSGAIETRISSDDIGDVFYFAEEATYDYAVTQKVLLDLDAYVQALKIDTLNVYSGIYKLGQINGKLYMVSRDYNHIAMIYNVAAVREAGLTESVHSDWTWAQFLDICRNLTTDTDGDGEIDQCGATFNMDYDPIFIPFFEAYAGRGIWCDTETKKITFVDEAGLILQAIRELVDAARQGYVAIDGTTTATGTPVFRWLVYPNVANVVNSNYSRIEWDLINLPLFPNASFGTGSSGVGVYNRTANPDTAAAFALFFFTEEGQRAYNGQIGGSVPLLNSLKDSDFWRYPSGGPNGEPEWITKNWGAFVIYAEEASTVGQTECLMPKALSDIVEREVGSIIKSAVTNGDIQSMTNKFQQLETRCNELWQSLIE